MKHFCLLALGLSLSFFAAGRSGDGDKRVALQRTPDRGIQPQAVMDDRGTLHLLYFKGEPGHGDLHYVRRDRGKTAFSEPLRVNSQPGSAVAVGSIRGGQLAVGKNGRAHVAWNGSGQARPQNPHKGHPMLYARLNDAGGHVYVAWHALKADSARGEDNRQVWLVRSADEGKTFTKERTANAQATGACGCCGMKAFADAKGNLFMVYRTARAVHRDMYLLASADRGKSFQGNRLHRWEVGHCPMSSEAFAQGPGGLYAAWDTKGQVHFARIKRGSAEFDPPVAASGHGRERKHPALAVNAKGEMILVWTEGTGWQRGGDLAWQVYDPSGRPSADHGRLANAVPVWGLPAVVAEADGRFTIFH